MEFLPITNYLYEIDDYDRLGREIDNALSKAHGDNEWIKPILEGLKEKLQITQSALEGSSKSPFTKKINDIDDRFDKSFPAFRNVIYNFAECTQENKRAAAELLEPILKKNNDKLHKEGYDKQETRFNSLVIDLNDKAAAKAMAILNVAGWFEDLKEMIAQIAEMIRSRHDENIAKDIPTNKEAIDEIKPKIKQVLGDVEFLYRNKKVKGLDKAMASINEEIKRLNAAARARDTRKQNEVEAKKEAQAEQEAQAQQETQAEQEA